MALFGGFRRKHDKTEPETAETDSKEQGGEEAPLEGAATWYRAMHLNAVPAGEDVLLQNADRAAPDVLPTFELELLAQCTHFAPVEAHASEVARRTGLPAEGVTQRLYELVDRGLLISQQEILARARVAADADIAPAPVLDRIAVMTSDRPGSLAACLGSYRERYGADLELVVFDDSGDAATREENRRVATQAGGRILYAGDVEKRRMATELSAKSGVEPEVVRAALGDLDGYTWHCGGNRNSALLDASGETVLMVDDDTTARAAYPPERGDGLRLSSRNDPWSVRFFGTMEEALEAADWRDTDILASHRRFLGRSPATCAFGQPAKGAPPAFDASADFDLNEADTGLITAFARGRGRVVVTSAGMAGDSGMAPHTYFLSAPAARERLLEDYQSHRATRAVHRSADVATVSNTRMLMTPHVAFDVRATIPPFSPVLRNEDGVFGALLRTCAPESYIAFLPWSIEHVPPGARVTDFDQIVTSISRVGANTIIMDLAHSYDPAPGVYDPTVRLRAFGAYMAALGDIPPTDFDAFVRYRITAVIGGRIERLMSAVNRSGGQPEQWADDCATIMTEGLRRLTEEELVASNVPGASSYERNRRFQQLLSRFGLVVEAWPTLLEAAADLRMAEPIKA